MIFIICAYFFISFTDAVEPERIGAAIDDMVGSERAHKLLCGIRGADKALGHAERDFAADSTLRECREQSLLSFRIKSRSFIEIGLFRKAAVNRIEHETQLFAEGIDRIGGDEYAVIFEQEHIAVFARASLEFKHLVAAELRQHIARAALLDPDEIAVYHPARGALPAL